MILPKQWVSKRIMTKADVEEIVKRYPFVIEAIKTGREKAIFYTGNRKRCIEISEDVKAVCAIFDDIQSRETDKDVLCMMDGIKRGRRDLSIMQDVHWQKNAYYERKSRLVDKIFECCILQGFVQYEEIMGRNIA